MNKQNEIERTKNSVIHDVVTTKGDGLRCRKNEERKSTRGNIKGVSRLGLGLSRGDVIAFSPIGAEREKGNG